MKHMNHKQRIFVWGCIIVCSLSAALPIVQDVVDMLEGVRSIGGLHYFFTPAFTYFMTPPPLAVLTMTLMGTVAKQWPRWNSVLTALCTGMMSVAFSFLILGRVVTLSVDNLVFLAREWVPASLVATLISVLVRTVYLWLGKQGEY